MTSPNGATRRDSMSSSTCTRLSATIATYRKQGSHGRRRTQERFVNIWIRFEKRFAAQPKILSRDASEVRNIDPEMEHPRQTNDRRHQEAEQLQDNHSRINLLELGQYSKHLTGYDDGIVFTRNYAPLNSRTSACYRQVPLLQQGHAPYPERYPERCRDFKKSSTTTLMRMPTLIRWISDFSGGAQPTFGFKRQNPERIVWCGGWHDQARENQVERAIHGRHHQAAAARKRHAL